MGVLLFALAVSYRLAFGSFRKLHATGSFDYASSASLDPGIPPGLGRGVRQHAARIRRHH